MVELQETIVQLGDETYLRPIVSSFMPPKAQAVVGAKSRYKVIWGGRGKGASYAFADSAIAESVNYKLRYLCTREIQNTIRDSVHRLLCDRISELSLDKYFNITQDSIISNTGSEFIFKGLRRNISEIKSLEGIDRCWVEEAGKVSQDSWNILIPTIRKEGSEIWVSFNPDEEKDPTYQRFVLNPPPNCVSAFMTYEDNEMFPEVLRVEMEYDKRTDFEKYEHIWLGKLKKYAHALIFKDKVVVEDFATPEGVQFYYGADWGFSNDPTCLDRMFIKDNCLYIDQEFYGIGIELDDLESAFLTVSDSKKWIIRGDSARPETISFLNKRGFNIEGVEKGAGSVEEGITFLRNFVKIIIHPRCKGAIDNFLNYKWKVDRVTGEILPLPVDASNHVPDACRYALEPYIKQDEVKIWSL